MRRIVLPIAIAIVLLPDAGIRIPAFGREAGAVPLREASIASQAAVDRDSLESIVRFLSVDPATGGPRTRFVLREEPLRIVADSLAARLGRSTGAPVERYPFSISSSSVMQIDSLYTGENVAVRFSGNGAVSGTFLLTAHYDAIGLREPGWEANWRTWAAPGADDNATGVATVMEAARILPQLDLPFDVMFVLFSGEELGLLGSSAFVDTLPDIGVGRIIGVLNVDMIGYSPLGYQAGTVVSNASSDWLAALIAQAARKSDPSFPLAVLSPGPSNSDHAPFWGLSIPAVMFIEPLQENMLIASPYYHSLSDTMGNVDFGQVERIANIVVDFFERIGNADAEAALFPSDVVLLKGGYPNMNRAFSLGDTMTVRVRARNTGCTEAPPGSDMRLTISIENGSIARTLSAELLEIPDPLDAETVETLVVLDESMLGANVISAAISVRGMNDDAGNNRVELWTAVEGEAEVVLMHAVQPNPVAAGLRSASFCVNLSRSVDIGIFVYNLEGESVGTAYAGSRWGEPLKAGMNCLGMSTLFPNVDRVASGVYYYRLVLYENGAARTSYPGRFAVQQ